MTNSATCSAPRWTPEHPVPRRTGGLSTHVLVPDVGRQRVDAADASAWLTDTSAARYSNDECAIRFGYRLVVIHPFPNGNGRWSRLASDALIVALGGSRFSWGGTSLAEPGVVRRDYIAALQAADTAGDFQPLLAFSRR